jgi:hypothetical protein
MLPPLILPSYGPGGIFGEGDNPTHILAMLTQEIPVVYTDQAQGYWGLYAPDYLRPGGQNCFYENPNDWYNSVWLCEELPQVLPVIDDVLVDRINRQALDRWFTNAGLAYVRFNQVPDVAWINTLPNTHPNGVTYQTEALRLSQNWPTYLKQAIADSQPDSFVFFQSPLGALWIGAVALIAAPLLPSLLPVSPLLKFGLSPASQPVWTPSGSLTAQQVRTDAMQMYQTLFPYSAAVPGQVNQPVLESAVVATGGVDILPALAFGAAIFLI